MILRQTTKEGLRQLRMTSEMRLRMGLVERESEDRSYPSAELTSYIVYDYMEPVRKVGLFELLKCSLSISPRGAR
jgi:hypothetical protein